MSPHPWKTGDSLRITYGDRTVSGQVLLASPNAKSLMLSFGALLGGYVGRMPVLWNDASGGYECLIERRPVTLSEVAWRLAPVDDRAETNR